MKQKTIYIYHNHICQIGGVETFLYNFCLNLRNYYDITVFYSSADREQLLRLRKLVKLEIYDKNKIYECDIFLRNSVWGIVPDNFISKDNRYLEMRHANYKFLLDKGKLYEQYHKLDKTNEVIGCGEFVSEMSRLTLNDNPTTIMNILAPKVKTNKILKLISCTRIDSEKGWTRMLILADKLRNANIKFEWKIFTNSKVECNYEEIHFYKQRFNIWDYLAEADYTVLLSDSEGLPYTVQESLQYKVPCIVTDVGGCTEIIKDGINGYIVPLDMNFDVKKLLNIPKCPKYDNHSLEKWLDYLGDGVYIEKEEEEQRMRYLVKATDKYITKNKWDGELSERKGVKYYPKPGEQWEVDFDRKEHLVSLGFVTVVKEIEEKQDKPKTTKSNTRKKSEK